MPAAVTIKAPEQPAPPKPKWDPFSQTDKMDDAQVIGVRRYADEEVTTTFHQRMTPRLWVVCNKGTTNVRIDVGSVVDSEVRQWESDDAYGYRSGVAVRLRIDQSKPISNFGQTSEDQTSIFLARPIPILKAMLDKKTLLVEFTPYTAGPQTLTFSIDGLQEALGDVRKQCKW